ncbi:hypothetical protein JZ751_027081 [Albula glossodonta]|uniref:Uncharacterized protein n=1 Tax=Albula glossodonta TaxID=121402 RepID=A0A8T2NFP3_9TELE|nr:hypothetical protein JZ751_027081 [Albula glossodonta]
MTPGTSIRTAASNVGRTGTAMPAAALEAYCEYLRSINYISHALLEDAVSKPDGETVTVEVERMLRLAEQCLERLKSFVGKRGDLPNPVPTLVPTAAPPPSSASGAAKNEVTPVASDPPLKKPTRSTHRRVLSDGGEAPSPFLPPEIFQKLQEVESQDTKKQMMENLIIAKARQDAVSLTACIGDEYWAGGGGGVARKM